MDIEKHIPLVEFDLAETRLAHIVDAFSELQAAKVESYTYYAIDEKNSSEVAAFREDQKRAFLDGETENPVINIPNLFANGVDEWVESEQSALMTLSLDALDLAHDDDRVREIEGMLGSAWLELELLRLSKLMQKTTGVERQEAALAFAEANDILYGKIDESMTKGLLNELFMKVEAAISSDASLRVKAIAADLKNLIVHPQDAGHQRITPTQEQLEQLNSLVVEENNDILSIVPERSEPPFEAEEIAEIFKEAHRIRGTGWEVKIIPGRNTVSSDQADKTTRIGFGKKAANSQEAKQVLLHENGIHVEREFRARGFSDPLIRAGKFPGSLSSEEGLASAHESIISLKAKDSGVQYYTILGLAKGLDGGALRNFREVFEIQWRREAILAVAAGGNGVEKTIDEARSKAYNDCVRIFRGTTCDIPGVVYSKDQSYYVGNQQAWVYFKKFLELPSEEQEKEYDFIRSAKFDQLNPRHRRIMQAAVEREVSLEVSQPGQGVV